MRKRFWVWFDNLPFGYFFHTYLCGDKRRGRL